jgi:hypothetical protein
MLLATTDDRDPLTAAIAAAKRAGHADCAKWREDLTAMTAELAAKFFGTRSVEMIRSGLAMSIKLLGMGLLEQSKGAVDVAAWMQALERLGMKGVTSTVIERIKLVATLPESPMLSGLEETEPRTLLLLCTSCADAKEAWLWLAAHAQIRRENLSSIRLARWLLAQTPSGRVKDRNLRHSDEGNDMLLSDEVIHEILANVCGLPRGYDDLGVVEPCKLAPAKYRDARVAYDALVARLDEGHQKALMFAGKSWFDRYVLERKAAKSPAEKAKPSKREAHSETASS